MKMRSNPRWQIKPIIKDVSATNPDAKSHTVSALKEESNVQTDANAKVVRMASATTIIQTENLISKLNLKLPIKSHYQP